MSFSIRPQLLRTVCEQMNHPLTLNLRPSYDHSYYFISTYLKQAEFGKPVTALCCEHDMSNTIFYKWHAKYSGTDA